MVIGIDFDGTIHDWEHPVEGRHLGPPLPGAKEALDRLKANGHSIVIHSCNREEVIEKWMKYWQIPYDVIWNAKPNCDVFIDDRALHFTSWTQTMRILDAASKAQ